VVRAAQDRCIAFEQDGVRQRGKLWAYAESWPTLGEREVDVPARDGQPARQATGRVAAGRLPLVPPRQLRGEHRKELLEV
jgi:hypothetical protein